MASDGQPPGGFLDPAFYTIAQSSIYNQCFHDTTNGNDFWPGSPSEFNTAVGYDLCTGWGTPNGSNLINTLAGYYAGPVYVNFNYTGSPQNGLYDTPYSTMAQATNGVHPFGTVIIETAGSSTETMTISKPKTIRAIGGSATIGQ